jgi:hypothetical protein
MFQTKFVEKIKTHVVWSGFLRGSGDGEGNGGIVSFIRYDIARQATDDMAHFTLDI